METKLLSGHSKMYVAFCIGVREVSSWFSLCHLLVQHCSFVFGQGFYGCFFLILIQVNPCCWGYTRAVSSCTLPLLVWSFWFFG